MYLLQNVGSESEYRTSVVGVYYESCHRVCLSKAPSIGSINRQHLDEEKRISGSDRALCLCLVRISTLNWTWIYRVEELKTKRPTRPTGSPGWEVELWVRQGIVLVRISRDGNRRLNREPFTTLMTGKCARLAHKYRKLSNAQITYLAHKYNFL